MGMKAKAGVAFEPKPPPNSPSTGLADGWKLNEGGAPAPGAGPKSEGGLLAAPPSFRRSAGKLGWNFNASLRRPEAFGRDGDTVVFDSVVPSIFDPPKSPPPVLPAGRPPKGRNEANGLLPPDVVPPVFEELGGVGIVLEVLISGFVAEKIASGEALVDCGVFAAPERKLLLPPEIPPPGDVVVLASTEAGVED